MAILHANELKSTAAARLDSRSPEARRLTLIYTLTLAVLGVGSTGLNLLLHNQIADTGGIGGMGLRSVLQTLQQILSYINQFFGPFWNAGFLYAMLTLLRGEAHRDGHLLEGFRRFGRILSGYCFRYLAFFSMMVLLANVASLLMSLTPLAPGITAVLEPLMTDPEFVMTSEYTAQLLKTMAPLLLLFGAMMLPASIFVSYSFRLATYLMMERRISGSGAHFLSNVLMKGSRWQMFKLDLSFWWYYLLAGLAGTVADLDTILTLLGVELPFGDTFWYFATLVLSWGLLLALFLWKKPLVDCTFLAAYEQITHPEDAVKF